MMLSAAPLLGEAFVTHPSPALDVAPPSTQGVDAPAPRTGDAGAKSSRIIAAAALSLPWDRLFWRLLEQEAAAA